MSVISRLELPQVVAIMGCDGAARRRRRSLPMALALALLILTFTAGVTAQSNSASATDDDSSQQQQVRCWKLRGVGVNAQLLASARGDACAVDIAFPLVSARFAPNDTVPVFWTVRLLATDQTTNLLGMRLPPLATSAALTQIAGTNVRVCSSRDQCDPSAAGITASTLQTRNFSPSGGSELFQSLNELRVATEGAYVLAAQVRVIDDLDASVSYYYAAFSDINVVNPTKTTVVLDKQTTYCRRSSQDALLATLSPAQSIAASSSCEVQVVVDSPDVAQPNVTFPVRWKATLTRDAAKDIRLPTPLTALDVSLDGQYYEIVRSTVKVCVLGTECDEYSEENSRNLLASTGASVLTGNFSNGVASFSLDALKLPAVGTYRAFSHLVLAGPNARRFDVTTFFHVIVTEENAGAQTEQEQFDTSSGAFYCWHDVGLANSSSALATTSVLAMGKNDECPFSVEMTLSSTAVSLTESVVVGWKIKQRDSFSATKFGTSVTLTSVVDSATNELVNVAQPAVYYCANATRCSPFSADKQLAFAATATNFSSGEAHFVSTNLSFPSAGNYTLFVAAAMPSGAAFRFDSAAFASVAVSAPAAQSSSTGGLGVGAIIGIVAAVIAGVLLVLFGVMFARRYMAKHRRSPAGKEPVFAFRSHTTGTPTRELRSDSRDSNVSDDSGTFMYVKAAPSPYEDVRTNSLSYDPYARPSFTRLSTDDANYTFTLPADVNASSPTADPQRS